MFFFFFFFNDTATTEIYTLSLHDALPISLIETNTGTCLQWRTQRSGRTSSRWRSEEHTSELQSLAYLVCRLLLEKKKKRKHIRRPTRKKPTRTECRARIHHPRVRARNRQS